MKSICLKFNIPPMNKLKIILVIVWYGWVKKILTVTNIVTGSIIGADQSYKWAGLMLHTLTFEIQLIWLAACSGMFNGTRIS